MNPSKKKSPRSSQPKTTIRKPTKTIQKPKRAVRKPKAHGPPKRLSMKLIKNKLVYDALSQRGLPNDVIYKIMYPNEPHSGLLRQSPRTTTNNVLLRSLLSHLPTNDEMNAIMNELLDPLDDENLAALAAIAESKNSRTPKEKKQKPKQLKPKQLKPKRKRN